MKTLLKLLLATFAILPTHATTYTVTNNADAGPGSLRQAILDANANAGPDIINFAAALNGQKILLTSGSLTVTNSVSILGPGPNQLAIDGNGANRVFLLNPGQSNFIAGVTITNGHDVNFGGGLYNLQASLTLSNVVLSGNSAGTTAGAIYNDRATLTLQSCTLGGNSAGSAGAIYNQGNSSNSTLTLQDCTLSGNSAVNGGGAIVNYGIGANGTLTLQNCTLSGNSAGASGGSGIYSFVNFSGVAAVTIRHCTFSGNSSSGGGIVFAKGTDGGTATLTITHTLLAHGTGPNFSSSFVIGITNLGYNLSDDNSTASFATTVPNLFLGPLANNGGPTLTHALLPNSPAVNAGDSGFTGPPAYDQRGPGFPRVLFGRIDIGAFEATCLSALTVISTEDSGPGTLRQAVIDICAGGTITFNPPLNGTIITLVSGLDVTRNMSIVGLGPGQMTVERSFAGDIPAFRLLAVHSGVTATVSGLMLRNGNSADGGCLRNDGTLTVSNCVISGNFSSGNGGGGIYNVGTLTVADCALSNNTSTTSGGAIAQPSGGNTTINRCTFNGNAAANGGALFNQALNQNFPPTFISAFMNVTNCTFSGNSATSAGSAAYNISINGSAPAQLVMQHCTVSGNTGSFALFNVAGGAPAIFLVGGSIVGNNGGADTGGSGTPVLSMGYNLVSRADGFAIATGDQTGTVASPLDPLLGPLANNGGPTLTRVPLIGSPAFNAGNTNTSGFPATDQRGPDFPRILDGRIDIGAVEVEVQPAPPPSTLISPVWSSASNTFRFSFTNVAGAGFTVLASTNVALPLSNWTALGIASEPSSGHTSSLTPKPPTVRASSTASAGRERVRVSTIQFSRANVSASATASPVCT